MFLLLNFGHMILGPKWWLLLHMFQTGPLLLMFQTRPDLLLNHVIFEGVGEGSSSKAVLTSPAAAGSPGTPTTPGSGRKENVWRSVFHPGSNIATRGMGTNLFDKPSHPNSPTVYDWYFKLYFWSTICDRTVKIRSKDVSPFCDL